MNHELAKLVRRRLGMTPIRPAPRCGRGRMRSRPLYGYTVYCTCGWFQKVNGRKREALSYLNDHRRTVAEIDKLVLVRMRRFVMNRVTDQTGVSGTGIVLHGVVCADGQVVVHWRPPLTSIAIYKDFALFKRIHMDAHPNCNAIIWLDPENQIVKTGTETGDQHA